MKTKTKSASFTKKAVSKTARVLAVKHVATLHLISPATLKKDRCSAYSYLVR